MKENWVSFVSLYFLGPSTVLKSDIVLTDDWSDNARDILNFLLNFLPDRSDIQPLPVHLTRVSPETISRRRQHGFRERNLVTLGHSLGGGSA